MEADIKLKEYEKMDAIALQCECGEEILEFLVDREDYEGYWSLYELSFGTYQRPFTENIKENLRLIWAILRGKRYWLYSIIIPKEKMDEFKAYIAGINTVENWEKKT